MKAPHYLMQYFQYAHLPAHLQAASKPFGELAEQLDRELPDNPEKTAALHKLLQAKDCAVRARLFKAPASNGGGA
jgi:hypothetical protein